MCKYLKPLAMCTLLLLVSIILAQSVDAFTITMTNETQCDVSVRVFVVNGIVMKDGVVTNYPVGSGAYFTINKGANNIVKEASPNNPKAQISRLDGYVDVRCKDPGKPLSLPFSMCADGIGEDKIGCNKVDKVVAKDISITIKKDPDGKFHFKRLN